MKRSTIFQVLIIAFCVPLTAASFQDIEIYVTDSIYYARGQVDGKILRSTKSAVDVIQFAINVMPEEGGEVFLHRGTYPLDKPIILKSKVWLHGKGRGTLLQITPANSEGVGILSKGIHGVRVSDLSLQPILPQTASTGLIIDDTGDSQFKNLHCQGFRDYGIWLRNSSFLVEVTNCQLGDNSKANLFCENLAEGSRAGDFVPNLVSNCIIYGGGNGIECKKAIVLNITGCLVFQTKGHGFYLHSSSNSVLITGCRTFQIEKNAVVIEGNSHEANITGNIFCWHRGHGIVFDQASWATVSGNNIIDTGVRSRDGSLTNGIMLRNVTRAVQITGNNLFNWGDQVPMLNGITEDNTCYNNQIISNNINYFTGEGVISKGKNSLVDNNLAAGPEAFVSDGKPPYPDFDMNKLKEFFEIP